MLQRARLNVSPLSLFSQTRQGSFCIFLSEKKSKPNKMKRISELPLALQHVSAMVRFTNHGHEIAFI